jgi:VWFA-related protein
MRSQPQSLRAAAAALILAFAAVAPATAQAQVHQVKITQVDTSAFPQVTVYIAVTDAAGNPLGIDPARLVVLENGDPVEPAEVRGLGEAAPVTTVLVIDISGSMGVEGKLAAAQAAARSYLEQMREGDRAGLIAFDTEVRVVKEITDDRQALISAVNGLQVAKDTAMYDAVDRAVAILEAITGRKAVLLLSDGMDNRSTSTASDVLAKVSGAELSVYAIGFGDVSQAPGDYARLDEATLRGLAENSGGSFAVAAGAQQLTDLFQAVGRGLQSEYAVTYVTPVALRDGVSRALTVQVDTGAAAGEGRYNPGGLVPEVARPAAWGPFALVLAGLAALLVLPGLARRGIEMVRTRGGRGSAPEAGRVRLHEPRQPRVRVR